MGFKVAGLGSWRCQQELDVMDEWNLDVIYEGDSDFRLEIGTQWWERLSKSDFIVKLSILYLKLY